MINLFTFQGQIENVASNTLFMRIPGQPRLHHLIIIDVASMQNLAGSVLFLPQGGTHFQLVPLGSPQRYFMGKFSPLTSIKFLHPMPPCPKVIQIIRP